MRLCLTRYHSGGVWGRRVETLKPITIQIPDDLARGLEGIAAAQHRSVEEVAVEWLPPHPSRSAMDELDGTLGAARLPVCDHGAFTSKQRGERIAKKGISTSSLNVYKISL